MPYNREYHKNYLPFDPNIFVIYTFQNRLFVHGHQNPIKYYPILNHCKSIVLILIINRWNIVSLLTDKWSLFYEEISILILFQPHKIWHEALENDHWLVCETLNHRHSNIPWRKTSDSVTIKTFKLNFTGLSKGIYIVYVVPLFEKYKTNDINRDALYQALILFVQSVCIRRHHLPKQHLFLNISPHNNIQCFSAQREEPVWYGESIDLNDGLKREKRKWNVRASYLPEASFAKDGQKVKIVNRIFFEPWNRCGWCRYCTRSLKLCICIWCFCIKTSQKINNKILIDVEMNSLNVYIIRC